MRALPIGTSDFKAIVEGGYLYVDKTKFIEEIIENFIGTKLYLRPRRFGKTTNMQMLSEYFDVTKKEENKDLFKGLYIDSVEEYKQYQNAYPVIFISLKEIKQDNWEKMYGSIKSLIVKLYNQYDYVKEILKSSEIKLYERIVDKRAAEEDYSNSLRDLTEYLYRYYNKQTVLLIDEYDIPLNTAYTKGFLEKSRTFISAFLSGALKDNKYLQVGILTGVLQIGQQSIFSDLNNFNVYSVFKSNGSEYFGFTKSEVKQMLEEYNLLDKYEEVEKWYDGYNIGNVEIFNPWSILQYLDNQGQVGIYWVNTGNTNLLQYATQGITGQTAEAISKLLKDETIEIEKEDKTVYEQLQSNYTAFMNTLIFSGYLTVENVELRGLKNIATLRIPNNEVKVVLGKMQEHWLGNDYQYDIINDICSGIINQNDKLLNDTMNRLMLEDVSYFSSAEEYYKGMFAIALTALPKEYIYKSEVETGYGRDDYEIYKEDKSIGMIFEFKACKKERDIEKSLEEGMEQIYQRRYYTKMEKDGIKEIYLYSIAFCKKKMLIKKELYVPKE